MKRIIAFLLLLCFMLAFTACAANNSTSEATKDKETTVATEKATETIAETEPETVPSTETEPTEDEPVAESEEITLPFISDHTAAELINYNVPELVALMGNDFDVELCGKRLVYYTSGGLCFYNDETLPGYAFFIDEAEGDISRLMEAGKSDEEAYAEIKENILSGKYKDYDFFCIYGGARYNDEITSDMRYVELSEILGSFDLAPIVGSMSMRQPINLDPPATIYYESVYGTVSYENVEISEEEHYDYYNIDEAKEVNPQAVKIAVIKETENHH